jgi:hypothetical protein
VRLRISPNPSRAPNVPPFVDAEQRIPELEGALGRARAAAEAEQRRADLLERTAQDAYERCAGPTAALRQES